MKRIVFAIGAIVTSISVVVCGCSKEDRNEVIDRLGKAGKALNGEVNPDDEEHAVPNIVAEQQRKERIRQNTKWTAENRAKHPIEYCNAQLEEVSQILSEFSVQSHKYAVEKSRVLRMIADEQTELDNIELFLSTAKRAYRAAESSDNWPMNINGYTLSKEKAQEKIVVAAKRVEPLKQSLSKKRNVLATIENRLRRIEKEQRNALEIKERLNMTISDLRLKNVIECDNDIVNALNAIGDAIGALGYDVGEPSVDDLLEVGKDSSLKATFESIMSE